MERLLAIIASEAHMDGGAELFVSLCKTAKATGQKQKVNKIIIEFCCKLSRVRFVKPQRILPFCSVNDSNNLFVFNQW